MCPPILDQQGSWKTEGGQKSWTQWLEQRGVSLDYRTNGRCVQEGTDTGWSELYCNRQGKYSNLWTLY